MHKQSPILVEVGTRPEIIKMAPIIPALQSHSIPFIFLHCGQHYDYNMSQQFIEQLNLPAPDYNHKIMASQPAQQTAQIITKTTQTIQKTKPAIVLTEGDTNSTLATALAQTNRKPASDTWKLGCEASTQECLRNTTDA